MRAGIDPGVGDWLCPKVDCGNWNWAKRNECNKCFTPNPRRPSKPPTEADKYQDRACGLDTGRRYNSGGGDRAGSSGGYREVDPEEERARKKRKAEREEEKEKRKASKERCKFCKRYTCVC